MVQLIAFIVQLFALFIAISTVFYMVNQKPSVEQEIFLTINFCVVFYDIAYLLQILTGDPGNIEAFNAFQEIALNFLPALYLVFITRYFRLNINRNLMVILIGDGLVTMLLTLTNDYHHWMYIDKTFVSDAVLPYVESQYGFYTYIDSAIVVLFLIYCNVKMAQKYSLFNNSRNFLRNGFFMLVAYVLMLFYVLNPIIIRYGVNIMAVGFILIDIILIELMRRQKLFSIVPMARERIFETMSDSVMVIDNERRLMDINGIGKIIFPELAEVPLGEKIPDLQMDIIENTDDSMVLEHNGVTLERKIAPIMNDNVLEGYSIVFADITHLKKLMDEMKDLAEKARAASDAKSHFLANMSHEIRTPMNAIIGYSDLLLKEPVNKNAKEYAQSIKTASANLLYIINDILDFSKIEQGKMELVNEVYSSKDLYSEIYNIMSLVADKKGLALRMNVSPEMPPALYGDRLRLRQIIINIVNNAIKFSKQGTIKVDVECTVLVQEKVLLTISVADQGMGISPTDKARLFNEFERADMAKNRGIEGSGLGLSISRSLAQLMGGDIQIESEYGVGTTVYITVVHEKSREELLQSEAEREDDRCFSAKEAKILVVDDNPVNLELMKNYLRQYDIVPDLAESGAKSIELAKVNDYNIIFMDQMMPEMDGVEAMKRIRGLAGRGGIFNIIALTANAISGVKAQLMAEGFDDYVSKPLSLKQLQHMLLQYIPRDLINFIDDNDSLPEAVIDETVNKPILPPYIDREKALSACGGDEFQYHEVLKIVHKYAEEKLELIQELVEKEDWKNYTVEVHALKSNAATAGAMILSEEAKAQEFAGKEGRIEDILSGYKSLIDHYRGFAKDLCEYLYSGKTESDDEESSEISEDDYIQTLNQIVDCIDAGEYDNVGDLLENLTLFEIPFELNNAVMDMQDCAEAGDYDGVKKLIFDYKEDMRV